MKAIVFRGIGDIRLEDVADPKIVKPTDAIVRLTASAICGTDLHLVRGTVAGMKPGTILGHEGVGIVEAIGDYVRNLTIGDRVVIPATIACGNCSYCRAGYYAQCDKANPNGPTAGTAFFGGPANSGPFQGLQAEKARVPYANVGLVKLPENVTDDQALLLSDIFPTGFFGAELADIHAGSTVAVFGCGPVGQFVIASAKILRAGRIIAIDTIPSRLEMARAQGAETIDFNAEDPVDMIRRMTDGIGVDRAIDAVGVDAVHPSKGPGYKEAKKHLAEFEEEVQEMAPETNSQKGNWIPGDAPSQVLQWAIEGLAKAGTLSIIGVYPEAAKTFPIGMAMNKNITVKMGNCNHRKYIPRLVNMVASGVIDPRGVLTNVEPLTSAIEAYKAFDKRAQGWMKVELTPAQPATP
jgi:threonine dehydrogenase-like Zn-dependent dehydrogenase